MITKQFIVSDCRAITPNLKQPEVKYHYALYILELFLRSIVTLRDVRFTNFDYLFANKSINRLVIYLMYPTIKLCPIDY